MTCSSAILPNVAPSPQPSYTTDGIIAPFSSRLLSFSSVVKTAYYPILFVLSTPRPSSNRVTSLLQCLATINRASNRSTASGYPSRLSSQMSTRGSRFPCAPHLLRLDGTSPARAIQQLAGPPPASHERLLQSTLTFPIRVPQFLPFPACVSLPFVSLSFHFLFPSQNLTIVLGRTADLGKSSRVSFERESRPLHSSLFAKPSKRRPATAILVPYPPPSCGQ